MIEAFIATIFATALAGLPWFCVFMGLQQIRNTQWNMKEESLEAQFRNEKDFD